MSDKPSQSFMMGLTELLELVQEAENNAARIDCVLYDHYVGLNKLLADVHGLSCSLHSAASALVSFVMDLIENSPVKGDHLQLASVDVRNLASMVLLLAEIKISLEHENVFLDLQ